MAQEIPLGEAVTGVVNTVEDNRDREYACSEKPTDQMVRSKINSQLVEAMPQIHSAHQLLAEDQGKKHCCSGSFLRYAEFFFQRSSLRPPYSVLLTDLQHMGALTQEHLSSSRDYLTVMCTLQHTSIPYSSLLVPNGAYRRARQELLTRACSHRNRGNGF